MKKLSIIGSTGSVGTQTVQLAYAKGYGVTAMACGSNAKAAEEQIRMLKPKYYALMDENAAAELRSRVADTGCIVGGGQEAVLHAASYEDADTVVNAATGIAGLRPSLAALNGGKRLALANKESLVCAGHIVMDAARSNKAEVLPVDSEHSAIFQCLRAGRSSEVDRLILTASGGPFFGWDEKMLAGVTVDDALRHPTWKMGKKITIDSATMMNKGFEVMEASWLFGVPADRIDVVVHRESILHSAVKFVDGSVIAQMGNADMRLPIQYAVEYPERTVNPFETLDIFSLGSLSFFQPDRHNFPALALCEEASKRGGNMGAVINGANEAAVTAFLDGRIGFLDIYRLVENAVKCVGFTTKPSVDEVFESDAEARRAVSAAL